MVVKPRIRISHTFALRDIARGIRHTSTSPHTTTTNPRATANLTQRLGHCIKFGLTPAQTHEAGLICREIAASWRELLAGSEGFLTSPERRGLFRQEVVWGDMDSMSHVNNVTYNRWAEAARMNWAMRYATLIDPDHREQWRELSTPRGDGWILKSIRTDFKFPMTYPDRVTVYHKLRELPSAETDSFALEVIILSERHRRVAARCFEEEVLYDYRAGKKLPLAARPFVLDAFRSTWALQQETMQTSRMKLEMLDSRVRAIELESWDREDAVEDLGGVKARK